jgi:hypothetical protein
MVDPKLPREFRSSAAYGDLLEAALAFASIFALRGNWRIAVPLVWVANTWGFVDLLFSVAVRQRRNRHGTLRAKREPASKSAESTGKRL